MRRWVKLTPSHNLHIQRAQLRNCLLRWSSNNCKPALRTAHKFGSLAAACSSPKLTACRPAVQQAAFSHAPKAAEQQAESGAPRISCECQDLDSAQFKPHSTSHLGVAMSAKIASASSHCAPSAKAVISAPNVTFREARGPENHAHSCYAIRP